MHSMCCFSRDTKRMDHIHENRQYQRYLVSQHLDCRVRLEVPGSHLLQLSDTSQGGMMVLLSAKQEFNMFFPTQEISGEIVSDNTDLHMHFSGQIVWKREFQESGRAFASMGIRFSSGVKLPEAIREMLSAEDD